MRTNKEVLEIFKSGIYEYVEIVVKQQHETLLGRLPNVMTPGFTGPGSCSQCNKHNLKPIHSKDECTSSTHCLCRSRTGDKRPCPNFICDALYESIIEDHMKCSPNIKTTDISKWATEYWEIAKCYMKHSSQSAENTDILDLLHLIANDRFVFNKVIDDSKSLSKEKLQGTLDKMIKICGRIKRLEGSSETDLKDISIFLSEIGDQNALKAIEKIGKITGASSIGSPQNGNQCMAVEWLELREAVYTHYKAAESKLTCNTQANSDLNYLQLFAEQTLHVGKTQKRLEEGRKPDSNVVDLIFGSKRYNSIFVEDAGGAHHNSIKWSEKEWFIFNILNVYYNTLKKDENMKQHSSSESTNGKYSEIILVSESVSKIMNKPFETFCEVILKDLLKQKKDCLVIIDVDGDSHIKDICHRTFKRHTVIKILDSLNFRNQKSKGYGCKIFVKTSPVYKLTVRNVREKESLSKKAIGVVQKILFKSVKKIGCKTLSLSFENIAFDDASTKIKLSCVSEIPCLQMNECAFTPANVNIVRSIEIISKTTCISHFLDQMKLVVYPAIQINQVFSLYVKTSEIKTRRNCFCIRMNLVTLNTAAKNFFRKPLTKCSNELFNELLYFEMAKLLLASDCDNNDYRCAEEKDRPLILSSIRYGLLQSHLDFVNVYAAECPPGRKNSEDVVFVCFMKENYDDDKERTFEKYHGFEIFLRSYNAVSTESLLAELSIEDYKFDLEETRTCIEETVAHHSDELMKNHSNLELISVSMGKAKNNSIDTTNGPCIVLYVRLKSFIPKGEKHFPNELKHPDKPLKFPIDVREGYFIALGDLEFNYPLSKVQNLVMGCSFGIEGIRGAGTVGPFVEIESGEENSRSKAVGFLTACHNFCIHKNVQTILGINVVQPSDIDVSNPSQVVDTVCGKVVACMYTDEVDAAVVEITKRLPRSGSFISCQVGDFDIAGLPYDTKYQDGSISGPKDAYKKNVVKFGKRTYLTSGNISIEGNTIRVIPGCQLAFEDPITREKDFFTMKNLLQFRNCSIQEICDVGDSGAGVFVVNENKELSCIGMAIGKTTDKKCIVLPIRRILENLSHRSHTELTNLKITMKTFC